jgi:TolB-like protein/DNA-binding winged helix-turn-helix (wHTH) protein/tetratricopeptide (TPR) repeat protein
MVATPTQSRIVKFALFEVDLEAGELRKSGLRQKLAGQPFEVLRLLLEHPQQIVTREELQQRIWPKNTFVDYDLALRKSITRLREVLGDSVESPLFIETIPRRGYRFIAPLSENGNGHVLPPMQTEGTLAGTDKSRRRLQVGVALGVAGAGLLLALLGYLPAKFRWIRSGTSAAPQIRSIAVLPLQNLSRDPEQEYFSDGMTDALITDLAQISSLKVISRTSSMQYKETKKSLPEIAHELHVDGIVEGTVQRSGDRVRITAQLVQGTSDKHLWANSYERDLRDVFAIEKDVTADIAHQIQAQLGNSNQVRPAPPRPVNPKALEAYLQGNYYLNNYAKGAADEEKKKAAEYFQQAIDADPAFTAAYIGLANTHRDLMWPSSQDVEIEMRATEKALALDPNYSDAHFTLANIELWHWDYSGAEEESRRAIALSPSNAKAHELLGSVFFSMGRGEEGMRECETAQALDPAGNHLAEAFYSAGEYDRAIEITQAMLPGDPNDGFLHEGLWRYYAAKGQYKEAAAELVQVSALFGYPESAGRIRYAMDISGPRTALRAAAEEMERLVAAKRAYPLMNVAGLYAILGDKDRAFYWMEEAYKNQDRLWNATDLALWSLNQERIFDPLRSDPRFKDLLHRVGLPDIQVPGQDSVRRTTISAN